MSKPSIARAKLNISMNKKYLESTIAEFQALSSMGIRFTERSADDFYHNIVCMEKQRWTATTNQQDQLNNIAFLLDIIHTHSSVLTHTYSPYLAMVRIFVIKILCDYFHHLTMIPPLDSALHTCVNLQFLCTTLRMLRKFLHKDVSALHNTVNTKHRYLHVRWLMIAMLKDLEASLRISEEDFTQLTYSSAYNQNVKGSLHTNKM